MRLRGPHVPIVLIVLMLWFSATGLRGLVRWKWPVVKWTMYQYKGPTEPVVHYRRFVVEHADGRREAIDLGRAFAFLSKPYRLDRGLDKNLAGLLEACLRRLRAREGDHLVALTFEKRTWRYQERSFDEHLAHEPPYWSYRVSAIAAPPDALRAGRSAEGNRIAQGDFRKLRLRSGGPRDWEVDARWFGIGIELATTDRAFLLAAGPAAQTARQRVEVPPGPFRLVALARATAPGAAITLTTTSGVTRIDLPADGTWHPAEVRGIAAEDGAVEVTLESDGAGDVYFDDIALYPEGG